ncbi:MAG: UDP binding domain-containing protein, partial [Bacteroidota bacterium]
NQVKKSLNGSKVLVLGVAYKQDIDDYRESPALHVIDKLEQSGAEVKYYDPYVPEYRDRGVIRKGEENLTSALLQSVDLVIITTAHSNIDYEFVQANAAMIFDTKNVMKHVKKRDNIQLL